MTNKRQILTAIIAVLISVGLVATAVYATTIVGNDVTVGNDLIVIGDTTLAGALAMTVTTTTGNLAAIVIAADDITANTTGLAIDISAITGGDFTEAGLAIVLGGNATTSIGIVLEGNMDFGINMSSASVTTSDIVLSNGATLRNATPITFGSDSWDPAGFPGGGLEVRDTISATWAATDGTYAGIRSNITVDADVVFSRGVNGISTRVKVNAGKLAQTLNAAEILVDVSAVTTTSQAVGGTYLRGMLIGINKEGTLDWDNERGIELWALGGNALAEGIYLLGDYTNAINLSAATVGTDIVLSNSETIANTTDGTIALDGDEATSTISVGSASTTACIRMRTVDDAGWTYFVSATQDAALTTTTAAACGY